MVGRCTIAKHWSRYIIGNTSLNNSRPSKDPYKCDMRSKIWWFHVPLTITSIIWTVSNVTVARVGCLQLRISTAQETAGLPNHAPKTAGWYTRMLLWNGTCTFLRLRHSWGNVKHLGSNVMTSTIHNKSQTQCRTILRDFILVPSFDPWSLITICWIPNLVGSSTRFFSVYHPIFDPVDLQVRAPRC